MEKTKDNLLEEFEVTSILVGFMIGTGILALSTTVAKDAKQDAWISVMIGGLSPIIFSFLAMYYVKKHPEENILSLSKKYLGNTFGTICNTLLAIQFFIYTIFVANGLINIFIVYATAFLTPLKILIPSLLLTIYLSSKGIKVLARINNIALYFSVILTLLLLAAFLHGNYLNVLPILGSGYKNILKSSIESAYSYAGIEAIFLIYPMMKNKQKIKSVTLKATFITVVIYTWIVFVTIYFLGYKVINKTLWPTLLLTEGVDLPVLNSFRLIFLLLWSFVIFKTLSNVYYIFSYILAYSFKIKNKNKIYWITFPLMIYICLKVGNEVSRRALLEKIIPKVALFNYVYVVSIALFIFIKDKIYTANRK